MQFKKTVLDNGLRVLTVPMAGSITTTVLVLVEAGSEYETKETNGISHFLEHMCFKGTSRRPQAIMIPRELELLGANYNAFTSTDHTGYYAKAVNANFQQILDLISDLYLNPIFDPAEIDKERGVIIEEINMYEDLPMEKVHMDLQKLMYGDQPAGWEVAGRKEIITKLTRDDFLHYRSQRYLAANTVVVVAGGVEEDEAIAAIGKAFSGMPVGNKIPKSATITNQSTSALLLKTKPSDQTHIALGFRAYSMRDPRRFPLAVLSSYLGEGMSSRLFTKIRNELGAAYYISSYSNLGVDHGEFIISAGLNHEKLLLAIEAILQECKALRENPLESGKLDEAKRKLTNRFAVNLETSNALAGYYGSQEIVIPDVLTPEEEINRYLAVTPEDVLRVAKDIFVNRGLNLAVIGPSGRDEALQKLLAVE
jgi:predicted Zn-dependent peptidase